ncbi:hypothetical protein IB229_04125 [Pseudomonas sp. PDM14]|uniref:hypothetical protein n=1 Tax=Pseudomonas sp. PDM14 TaxID=2769288 RepID=UPI00177D915E|nr:hypothetical protein [Pseudomonas sp. PDM14]MBD9482144.1 hypothetical protein [Pseudomonas sp. PDM14]
MSEVLSAIQSAIEIATKLRNLSKKIEDAEIKMLLADLSNELADAKLEMANLKIALAQETEKSTRLSSQLSTKSESKPKVKEGAYEFEHEEGLFCTACFDSKDKKIRLKDMPRDFLFAGKWECPVCNASYGVGR